jgi:serine/threonine-protein kinase
MADNVLSLPGDSSSELALPEAFPPGLEQRVATELGDRYRIDGVVGRGGMGVVFRGFHLLMKREVAIKVALPELTPDQRARFRREAEIGGRLDHPNCVGVYEFSTARGDLEYMVMPLVRGRPLAETLGERIEPETVAVYAAQLMRGLDHAHSQGIIHRDVKPANILVAKGDRGRHTLKLADFGIAKLTRTDDSMEGGSLSTETMTGLMAGTPAYMAPEQALALGCDQRSDLYSVGIVMHEMIMGALPYSDGDAFEQLRNRLTEEVPPLPAFVPAPLAQIVAKLLRGKREERYESATVALEDLEAYLAGRVLPHAGHDALAPVPVAASLEPARGAGALTVDAPAVDAPRISGSFEPVARSRTPILLALAGIGVAVVVAVLAFGDSTPASQSPTDSPTPAAIDPPEREPAQPKAEPAQPKAPAADVPAPAPKPAPALAETPTPEPTHDAAEAAPAAPGKKSPKKPPGKPKAKPATGDDPPKPTTLPRAPLLDDGLLKPSGM